jgi:hypothetical protein
MKKNIIKKTIIALLATFLFLSQFSFAFAQDTLKTNKPKIDDLLYKFEVVDDKGKAVEGSQTTTDYIASLPDEDYQTVVARVVYYALVVANILAFVSFLVAGVFMIMSMGNDEDIKKAKEIFTYTVIAMIICATALALVVGITKLQFFT